MLHTPVTHTYLAKYTTPIPGAFGPNAMSTSPAPNGEGPIDKSAWSKTTVPWGKAHVTTSPVKHRNSVEVRSQVFDQTFLAAAYLEEDKWEVKPTAMLRLVPGRGSPVSGQASPPARPQTPLLPSPPLASCPATPRLSPGSFMCPSLPSSSSSSSSSSSVDFIPQPSIPTFASTASPRTPEWLAQLGNGLTSPKGRKPQQPVPVVWVGGTVVGLGFDHHIC